MSWKYFNKSSVSKERMYEVIRSPLITEKGTLISSDNYVGFKVDYSSTKPEIKKAVSELFHVDVISVNTVRMKGKTKRFRGHKGKRSCFKKAFVRLKSGQSIDLTTGL